MNVALRKPLAQAEFFDWAEAQQGRYEFDGARPVAMISGTNNHGIIADNIRFELRTRLRGGPCRAISPDGGGVETVGNKVRCPEATVTCSRVPGAGRLIPDPVIVFEVVSPGSVRIDQVLKLHEYHGVPSIKRTVLVEQSGIALTVHSRQRDEPWLTGILVGGDVLALPEIGIEMPVAALYEGVEFAQERNPD